ncbi:kinase-like protein [Sistotremastrum niveocremeum HHB9708]|uniref:Kinase-like protein n=1 Tax=Sistotremastrum niveocremeum HHB9708 TaxID=1314777 RepID=A0A164WVY4_9AGAM|nr:kinase-like protein [Sistotremastrum niveocremeum HHB9708]
MATNRQKLAPGTNYRDFQDLTGRITLTPDFAEFSATGGSSYIYRATFSGMNIAVKVFRDVLVTSEDKRYALAKKIAGEMKMWSSARHENILPFLGYCFYGADRGAKFDPHHHHLFSLVSPWMENGTVIDYLRSPSTSNVPQIRIDLLTGVMNGLSYLHSNGIVHGDIKGSNILVSDDGKALLADFGLARLVDNDDELASTTAGLRGTIRWMAPEVACALGRSSNPARESDIWGFGCVVLEIIASLVPYQERRRPVSVICAMLQHEPPARYDRKMPEEEQNDHELRTKLAAFERYPRLWELCQACWDFVPASRPTCQMILEVLHKTFEVQRPQTQPSTPRPPQGEVQATKRVGEPSVPPFPPVSPSDPQLCSTRPLSRHETAILAASSPEDPLDLNHTDFQTCEAFISVKTVHKFGLFGLLRARGQARALPDPTRRFQRFEKFQSHKSSCRTAVGSIFSGTTREWIFEAHVSVMTSKQHVY